MSCTHLCVLLNAVGAGCHALTVHIALQLGKIGGRLRRQAVCLLAVVLDPVEEEAPALTKLLEQVPQVRSLHSATALHGMLCMTSACSSSKEGCMRDAAAWPRLSS